jgi:hypothetical protein
MLIAILTLYRIKSIQADYIENSKTCLNDCYLKWAYDDKNFRSCASGLCSINSVKDYEWHLKLKSSQQSSEDNNYQECVYLVDPANLKAFKYCISQESKSNLLHFTSDCSSLSDTESAAGVSVLSGCTQDEGEYYCRSGFSTSETASKLSKIASNSKNPKAPEISYKSLKATSYVSLFDACIQSCYYDWIYYDLDYDYCVENFCRDKSSLAQKDFLLETPAQKAINLDCNETCTYLNSENNVQACTLIYCLVENTKIRSEITEVSILEINSALYNGTESSQSCLKFTYQVGVPSNMDQKTLLNKYNIKHYTGILFISLLIALILYFKIMKNSIAYDNPGISDTQVSYNRIYS